MIEQGPTYRAGIIGCGSIASFQTDGMLDAPGFGLFPYTHAGVYQRHPRTQLVAAADINEKRLVTFGQRWQVSALYTDYREMLDAEDLDIVSIAALSHLHCEMTLEAAKRRVKGIFLEKPIARTLGEADQMIAACRSAGVSVAVNHTRTYDPFYRAAKRLVDRGEIGELRAVLSTWREGLSFGGSHLFDLLHFMIGAPVDWVFFHLDEDRSLKDPGGDAYLVFKNGVRVHINMPFVASMPAEADFIGTGGRIRASDNDPKWWKIDRREGETIFSQRLFPGYSDGKSGMYTAVEELIRAIETGEEPASTLEAGRAVLEVTLALLMSGKTGVPVKLPITDTTLVAEAMY